MRETNPIEKLAASAINLVFASPLLVGIWFLPIDLVYKKLLVIVAFSLVALLNSGPESVPSGHQRTQGKTEEEDLLHSLCREFLDFAFLSLHSLSICSLRT